MLRIESAVHIKSINRLEVLNLLLRKMSDDIVDFINHYKKSIEKHSDDPKRVSK